MTRITRTLLTDMYESEIKALLTEKGVSDVGFCVLPKELSQPLPYAVSIAVRLSDAVVDEITDKPTVTYFSHYRTVNAFIDRVQLETGLYLQSKGFRYIPVPASQSDNTDGWNYCGRFPHKTAARLSGLGTIGVNTLFIHREYGARVRLGTLLTDCPFPFPEELSDSPCKACMQCVKSCPAGAIKGVLWHDGIARDEMFDAQKCSEYMKNEFKSIGRGAVCGICMRVCGCGKEQDDSGV